jgi:hypothetical protein
MYINLSKNRLQMARAPETAQQMVVAATAFLELIDHLRNCIRILSMYRSDLRSVSLTYP